MQALSKEKKTGDICTIKWMFGIPEIFGFPAEPQNRRGQHHTGHPENGRRINPRHGRKANRTVQRSSRPDSGVKSDLPGK